MSLYRSQVQSIFCYSAAHNRDLHSFPTRRSSDLAVDELMAILKVVVARNGFGHIVTRIQRRAIQSFDQTDLVFADHCGVDRKSTRLNSSHVSISYAVFCLKKKKHRRNWD